MIVVRDLKKSYANIPAVRGISFELAQGSVTGFLGPNGAGKTTTLRILSGFMPASSGSVEIAGFDVHNRSREVRRRIGYLPEDIPLYRDMTVRAFLEYMAGLKEVPRNQVKRETERVIEQTGLGPVRNLLISKCSRGYRQRTGLAMALLGDPEVLLLDEPTSGLDPNQVVEVRNLIRELSGKKTVLLSSHILSEVDQICTHVLIIHEGRLAASGTPAELIDRSEQGRRLRLRGTIERSWLEGIRGVTRIENKDGTWVLDVEDPDLAAPEIAKAILEGGGGLIELAHESSDLESVFRDLTREAGDA